MMKSMQGNAMSNITIRLAALAASSLIGTILLAVPASAQATVDGRPLPFILSWTPAQQLERYKAIEKVYKVSTIKKGAKVSDLPAAATQIDPKINGQSVDAFMKAQRITGVIAVKDGKVILEKYGSGRTASDRWTSFSVAKSMTSTLIGAAIKDRYINNIYEPVTKYLPELEGSAYEGVSIRQLMTMTSGAKWNEDYTNPKSDVALAGNGPWKRGDNDPLITYMATLKREAEPGAKWVYKTGETDLAGLVLSRALAGKTLAQYAAEKIWGPYGMEQDGIWMLDKAGFERGGCCMSMTLRDYARIGLFMLGGGKVNGKDILPPGWVEEATANQLAKSDNKNSYGYFWWPRADGYAAVGVFGQTIQVYPEQNLVIAINSAMLKASGKEVQAARGAMLQAIHDAAT
jgi:CubicO group peptidase (beta-lactamase class C family)